MPQQLLSLNAIKCSDKMEMDQYQITIEKVNKNFSREADSVFDPGVRLSFLAPQCSFFPPGTWVSHEC